MGKLLPHREAKPGERFLGGRGIIIPNRLGTQSTKPSPKPSTESQTTQKPSTEEAPLKQPGPPKSGNTA